MKALLLMFCLLCSSVCTADDFLSDSATSLVLPDLGGQPVAPEELSALSASAPASTSDVITPCYQHQALERPREIFGLVLPLNLTAEPPLSSYWPGLNGSVWVGYEKGQLYALRDLRILRKNLTYIGTPSFSIYDKSGARLLKEALLDVTAVRTTQGLLLSAYFRKEAALYCLDILMSSRSMAAAKASRLYYTRAGTLFTTALDLRRLMSTTAMEWQ